MPTKKPIAITTLDLRRNIPQVRKDLQNGQCYVLLYRGKPIAEISAVSKITQEMFFVEAEPKTHNPDAIRIKNNVQRRKKKRILKNKTR
ncbi:MAG: hypothetical protein K9M03_03935 [Kiritimatiellales bacterium]|nr:hypothetical protein [Kiritimatiellales bacterium]